MKIKTLFIIGAVAYLGYRAKVAVDDVALLKQLDSMPPPNSGPVVNGLGNIFNQTKIMRRSTPQVERRYTPQVTQYAPPVRPRFSTNVFFR
jgi:hypothetical protein